MSLKAARVGVVRKTERPHCRQTFQDKETSSSSCLPSDHLRKLEAKFSGLNVDSDEFALAMDRSSGVPRVWWAQGQKRVKWRPFPLKMAPLAHKSVYYIDFDETCSKVPVPQSQGPSRHRYVRVGLDFYGWA